MRSNLAALGALLLLAAQAHALAGFGSRARPAGRATARMAAPSPLAALASAFGNAVSQLGVSAPGAAAPSPPAVQRLLELVKAGAEREAIEAAIDELPPSPPAAAIDGRWQLEWTSEKEVNFLREKGLFGTPCVGVVQDVRLEAGALENLVLFEDGCLRVGSTAARADSDPSGRRVDFKFGTCAVRRGGLELPLPPVGEGWFETVYVDGRVRVSRDVRGDSSVSTYLGPTELFSTDDADLDAERAVALLKRAAATRAVGGDAVVGALLALERRMREASKADAGVASAQLQALDGAWRLVFTTGTIDTQKATGQRINYFPVKAVQTFDTAPSPMAISNGIFLSEADGAKPLVRFFGPFEWLPSAGGMRRLEFDFDRIELLGGAAKFDLGRGKAAELGAKSGLGSKNNEERLQKGQKPFFAWAYADGEIATARGGGGGIALWRRTVSPDAPAGAD